ncbi:hypothetical protein NQ318_003030 [Aromia moschata]|uniref:Transposase n=1 Tax=Aromia moschata TaxID=1265417 RepID=A0AAV8YQ04_9CUCU|nr:hypothetical protein NQ318_003030 [Aromia moschata]
MPRHNLFSNEKMRDMRQPGFKIFENLYDILGETGSLRPKRDSAGRPKTLNPEQEEEILVRVAENPELSTRRIAMETGGQTSDPYSVTISKKACQTTNICVVDR